MTESTTWLSIAADDLRELRQDMFSGEAFDEEKAFMRLLWDLSAGIVGLAQEMHNEHRETVKIWKQSRLPAHTGGDCTDCPRCQAEQAAGAPA